MKFDDRNKKSMLGHLNRADRSLREAQDILHGRYHDEPESSTPATFRPVSPDRDRRRTKPFAAAPNPAYMKPSRMPKRGRHGSRRRR